MVFLVATGKPFKAATRPQHTLRLAIASQAEVIAEDRVAYLDDFVFRLSRWVMRFITSDVNSMV
jgi:hypothetical protein